VNGKLSNKELRDEVFRLCDSLGFWNVRPVETANKLNTVHCNIVRWKKQYIKKFGIPDVEKMGKELNMNSQTALKELIKLMKSGSSSIKIQAARVFFDGQEKFTKFMENFNYKEKVAELVNVKTDYSLADAYKEIHGKQRNPKGDNKKKGRKVSGQA